MAKTQEELTAKLQKINEEELNSVTGGLNRDLNINPDESSIGTVSDENVLPPEINPRERI